MAKYFFAVLLCTGLGVTLFTKIEAREPASRDGAVVSQHVIGSIPRGTLVEVVPASGQALVYLFLDNQGNVHMEAVPNN